MIGLDSLRIKGLTLANDDEPNTTLVRATSRPTPLLDQRGGNYWGQSYNNNGTAALADHSYNKYCPTFFDCVQGRTYVGCTAVAMAQVMWYHKYPASAIIPSKINAAGTTYGTDETHIYNWNNMPNALYNTTSRDKVNAVAGLLRDCGYAGHMIYSGSGSSMTLTNAISAWRNTFNYSVHMKQYSSGATKFNNIIKAEIGAKRPVIIQATHKSDGSAHSFVIDGYDSANEMFHLNMGWKGSDNAWYSVSGTNCYDGYIVARRMLYEIIPNSIAVQSVEYSDDDVEEDSNRVANRLSIVTRGDVLDIQSASDHVQWAIYNIYGLLVLSGVDTYVNLSSLPRGAYTIVAQNENTVTQTTFIR